MALHMHVRVVETYLTHCLAGRFFPALQRRIAYQVRHSPLSLNTFLEDLRNPSASIARGSGSQLTGLLCVQVQCLKPF
jgi:hypothetical protein